MRMLSCSSSTEQMRQASPKPTILARWSFQGASHAPDPRRIARLKDEGARTAANVEGPDTLEPKQLMRADRKQIDVPGISSHIHWDLSHGLSRIAVDDGAMPVSDLRNPCDGLKGTYLIIGSLHRHQQRLVIDRRFSLVDRDAALPINRQHDQFVAFSWSCRQGSGTALYSTAEVTHRTGQVALPVCGLSISPVIPLAVRVVTTDIKPILAQEGHIFAQSTAEIKHASANQT